MKTCERCGAAMPDAAAICPSCGSTSALPPPSQTPPSDYVPSDYAQGYSPQESYHPQPSSAYSPEPGPGYIPQTGYGQSYNAPQMMYPPPVSINVNMSVPVTTSSTNNAAVVVEVLLNLINIYGIGWLMIGETTTGVILLVCSFLVYWPILVFGFILSILTFGLGFCGLIPLWLILIVVNAILLNNKMKQKARLVLVQPIQNYPLR